LRQGGTGTVTSINTSFPSGSKVAVIATVYAAAATTGGGNYLVGAGNIKLKSGATVVSSNQFDIGSYRDIYPLRASLIYLDTPTSNSQTYSIEITNGSTQLITVGLKLLRSMLLMRRSLILVLWRLELHRLL
jgi:hypothetical protein